MTTTVWYAALLVALPGADSVQAGPSFDEITIRTETGDDVIIRGTIVGMSKDHVVLLGGSRKRKYPVTSIRRIVFSGEPVELTRARSFIEQRRFKESLEKLDSISWSTPPRRIVVHEVEYFRVVCMAELALAGKGDKGAASQEIREFAEKHPDTFHDRDIRAIMKRLEGGPSDVPHSSETPSSVATFAEQEGVDTNHRRAR